MEIDDRPHISSEPIEDFKVWTCKDGRKVPVAEMSDEHLENTIKLLKRKFDEAWSEASLGFASVIDVDDNCWSWPVPSTWLDKLRLERDRRRKLRK